MQGGLSKQTAWDGNISSSMGSKVNDSQGFVRDPHEKLVVEQLNGCEFAALTESDWQLMLPYLERNETLFGISIERDLLVVNGVQRRPEEVYRKVCPMKVAALSAADLSEG